MIRWLKMLLPLSINKTQPTSEPVSEPFLVLTDKVYPLPYDRKLLIKELKEEEGVVRYAYDDSTGKAPDTPGYITIGVGRMIDKRRNGGLSDDEITYLLNNDLDRTEQSLDEYLPWWRNLDPVRARVIMNMTFNMGIGNSREGLRTFVNTLAHIEAGRYEQASQGMLRSKWSRQVKGRAVRLAHMMKFGEVPK